MNSAASLKDLTFTRLSGDSFRLDLESVVFVYDPNGVLVNSVGNGVHDTLTRDGIRAMLKTGLTFHQSISVPAKGDFYLRVAIRDLASNKIGALEVPVEAVKGLPVVAPPPANSVPATKP